MDAGFFSFLESNAEKINSLDTDIFTEIIRRCCALKSQVTAGDEREESGLRSILNFGHTFGHAVETVTGYGEFQHGEAVAIGMSMAANFAVSSLGFPETEARRIKSLFEKLSLPTGLRHFSAEKIFEAMKKDKKVSSGQIKIVAPDRIGSVKLVNADRDAIINAIRSCCD
jgi:3-dehydroquinate synthase